MVKKQKMVHAFADSDYDQRLLPWHLQLIPGTYAVPDACVNRPISARATVMSKAEIMNTRTLAQPSMSRKLAVILACSGASASCNACRCCSPQLVHV